MTDKLAPAQFLLEDYKLKVGWMTAHYDRVMRRLQMFVTLETALAALLVIAQTGSLSPAAPYVALVQAVLTAIWLTVGRTDRHKMRLHAAELKRVGELLAARADSTPYFKAVGDLPAVGTGLSNRLIESRGAAEPPIGAALLPLILLWFWIGMVVLLFLV